MKFSEIYIYSKIIFFIFLVSQFFILVLNAVAYKEISFNVGFLLFFAVMSMLLCLVDNIRNDSRRHGIRFFIKSVSYIVLLSGMCVHMDEVYFFLKPEEVVLGLKITKLITVFVCLDMLTQYIDRFLREKIDLFLRQKTPVVIIILIKTILVIFALTVAVIWVFGVRIAPALFTSSAVTGALIILATQMMKSSISNFFSGLLLVFSNPFKIGDVVSIGTAGTAIIGEVKEFNWRGVSLIEYRNDMIHGNHVQIPNEIVLNTNITNHTRHNESIDIKHNFYVSFNFDQKIAENIIFEIIEHSAILSELMEDISKLRVDTYQLSGIGVEYNVYFHCKWGDHIVKKSDFQQKMLHTLRCYGITNSAKFYNNVNYFQERYKSGVASRALTEAALELFPSIFPAFSCLGDEKIKLITAKSNVIYSQPGDTLLHQNEKSDTIFFVLYGVLTQSLKTDHSNVKYGVSSIIALNSSILKTKMKFSVMAVTKCSLLSLDVSLLQSLCLDSGELTQLITEEMDANELLSEAGVSPSEKIEVSSSESSRKSKLQDFFGVNDNEGVS